GEEGVGQGQPGGVGVDDHGDLARHPLETVFQPQPQVLHPVQRALGVSRVVAVVPRRETKRLRLDPRHESRLASVSEAQTRAGSGDPQTSRISWRARSNSSSAITGVPSKGRSRSISTQERQPWYSSRTRTVTGRGMRWTRSSKMWSGWRRFQLR